MNKILNSVVLLEGISHLEDLSADEFIKTVETMTSKIITEKLDGANLWFGVDEKGLFTSREGKSPKRGRFYSVDDYPLVANYNGFRAAHLALEKIEPIAKKILQVDDVIEVEILFGRQPNTITYGHNNTNFIVVLRGVNDTPEDRINALINALEDKVVKVESTIVSSSDGENLSNTDEVLNWKFTKVKPIQSVKIDMKEVNILLKDMKHFLSSSNEVDKSKTNKEILEISLGSVPKEKREDIKAEREKLTVLLTSKFKLPIKNLLLDKLVRKVKPVLQAKELDSSEDLGVEGVVLRDPVTGSQTKIVDKDIFTAINTFNSSVRNNVSGLVRTTNQDTSIDMRGGIFGQAKIRIADLMGAKELAMSSGVKRYVSKFKQKDAVSTATELAKNLNISSVESYKQKINSVFANAINEINAQLDDFKKDQTNFKLQLKTGKEIKLTPETIKKTLTAIAETKIEIKKIMAQVNSAKSPTDLVLALYGKTIQSLFEVEESMSPKYSFIKSFEEASADVSSASAIAPVEKKLLNGKVIEPRVRNFKKVSKFSPSKSTFGLIKSVNENWQHVDDMEFATDVDDKAETLGDPEFTAAKNNLIAGNITNASVTDYLDQAAEMNDSVDSVAFGLEMDDGQIVKVYVNAEQADTFEAKLAELLGQEDNIENVINIAAEEFDIVDVEWPEGLGPSTDENISDDATLSDESPDDLDLEPDHEHETEVPTDEEPENTEREDETDTAKSEDETDIESVTDESPEDEESSDEESSDEESSDEELKDEGDKPKKKKKKQKDEDQPSDKTTMEESMYSYSEQFKMKLLEGKKKSKKGEEKEQISDEEIESLQKKKVQEKFLTAFPTKQEKAIMTLILNLGVTQKMLTPFKAELRTAINGPSDLYLKDSVFRTFVKKFLVAMSTVSEVNEDSSINLDGLLLEEDEFLNRLSNSYQVVVYTVLRALGLSDGMVKLGQRQLLSGIRQVATLVQQNNDIRIYLFAIADHLGVDHRGILAVKKTQDKGEQDTIKTASSLDQKESKLKENTEGYLTEDFAAGVAAVSSLLTSLGVDVNSSIPVVRQLNKSTARTAMSKFSANSMLMNRFAGVTDMISKAIKINQPSNQQGQVTEAKEEIADFGAWTVGKLGKDGMMLSNDSENLKFDASEIEKLAYILDNKRKVQ